MTTRRSFMMGLLWMLGCASVPHAARTEISLVHLGVAGWSISDGKRTVLVDPYFSRPENPFKSPVVDEQAVAARLPPRVDVVLVGHAHPDHALDAPLIARRTGAPLMGSAEVIQQAVSAGVLPAQLRWVKGGEDYAFDGFSVRVIPSLHSVIGFENHGEVETLAFLVRMGGHDILVFDTANFIEREVAGLTPDVLIAATGLREKITDYACRLTKLTSRPPLVLATHFDAWRKPVGTPLAPDVQEDLRDFAAEIQRCAPGTGWWCRYRSCP